MKCRLKLPLAYDDQRWGYCYTRPVEQFPSLPMTEAEMFGLPTLMLLNMLVVPASYLRFGRPVEVD